MQLKGPRGQASDHEPRFCCVLPLAPISNWSSPVPARRKKGRVTLSLSPTHAALCLKSSRLVSRPLSPRSFSLFIIQASGAARQPAPAPAPSPEDAAFDLNRKKRRLPFHLASATRMATPCWVHHASHNNNNNPLPHGRAVVEVAARSIPAVGYV